MARIRNAPARLGLSGFEMASDRCCPSTRALGDGLRRARWPLLVAGLAGLAGCGDADVPSNPAPVREVSVPVIEARVPPDVVQPLTLEGVAVEVSAAGVAADGALYVADGTALYAGTPEGLRAVPFFTERPSEEAAAGRIVALQPRADGGAWVVATNGLYRTEGRYYVSVDASVLDPRAAFAAWTAPPLDGLWLVEDGALRRLSNRAASTYGWSDAVDALAVSADGAAALIASGEGAWQLRLRDDGALERLEVAPPVDTPRAVAHVGGAWWVGGSSLASADDPGGAWVLWAGLGPVASVGRGPDGVVWWTDADGLYARHDDEARRLDRAAVERTVFGPAGDVWVLTATVARGWRAGDRPSFANDIAPWLEAEGCVGCHLAPALDFRRYADFRGVAVDALRRVEQGDMPRCGSNLCPPSERIPPERFEVLDRWIATGMAP